MEVMFMEETFNQGRFFDNVYFLIKKTGKKIGEIESEAGVSPGYISRTSKEGNSKPGIDFIMSVAKNLNVSVDALLKVDFAKLTPTEEYLLKFFQKLSSDTVSGKLKWNKESEDYLNNLESDINGNVEHPLFNLERFYEEGETEYQDYVTRVVFNSNTFGFRTSCGDCFNLRLKNGVTVYVMNISKSVYHSGNKNAHAKEIWLSSRFGGNEFLCSNREIISNLFSMVDTLYMNIVEDSRHPKINYDSRKSIDAFMNDDLKDDKDFDAEVPF